MEWYIILIIVATILGLVLVIMQRGVLIAQRIKIVEQESEITRLQMELSELADLKIEPEKPMFEIKQTEVPMVQLNKTILLEEHDITLLELYKDDKNFIDSYFENRLYEPFYKEIKPYIQITIDDTWFPGTFRSMRYTARLRIASEKDPNNTEKPFIKKPY